MKLFRTILAATAIMSTVLSVQVAKAAEDPGPAAYEKALKGKRVLLVPMTMGFDLAQGWAAYLKSEVEGFGGIFETRDPNWSAEAGAQAITEAIASDTKHRPISTLMPSFSRRRRQREFTSSPLIIRSTMPSMPSLVPTGIVWGNLKPKRL